MLKTCEMALLVILSAASLSAQQAMAGGVPPSRAPLPTLIAVAGDPIDLSSGLYVRTTTDLTVDDTIPIELTRTYRNNDHRSRAFGVGTSHDYDMFIAGDAVAFTYVDLILAGGEPIHYDRISPGTGYADGVFEHTSTATAFYKSRITWNGTGWTVALADGSSYRLQGCSHNTSPGQCGVIEFRDSNGDALHVKRLASGDIDRITSPNGKWLAFTYDSGHRVVLAEASTGDSVKYEYDARGRLVKVTPSGQDEPARVYGYDDDDRMTKIIDSGQLILNEYEDEYCVHQLWRSGDDVLEFQLKYLFDPEGHHVGTDVREPDGSLRRVTFNEAGYALSDADDVGKPGETTMMYNVDPKTNALKDLSVTCSSQDQNIHVKLSWGPLQAGDAKETDELPGLCRRAATKPQP
jgi:YD repeat-containing protein